MLKRSVILFLVIFSFSLVIGCNEDNSGGKQEICDNEIDDNGNGLTDCEDDDCEGYLVCNQEICNNEIDDDGNGHIDCDDQDCFASDLCNELEEICNNGIDDNGNGDVDCDDSACSEHTACQTPAEICDNEIDDDGDGHVDCDDQDCFEFSECIDIAEICDNEIDDDEDGFADCFDIDCLGDSACNITGEDCDNGLDDDSDGDTDCDDSDCSYAPNCLLGIECDPVSDFGCSIMPGSDESCYFNETTMEGYCYSSLGTVAPGDSCTDTVECVPGYVCFADFLGNSTCKKLCHLAAQGECEVLCYDAYGSPDYGICLP
ncbi:MAG: hypothetical protein PF689_14655 [Deltaproteobacteria bacterium]|jgi:hypothetical protein|nr:hypothetical protein [Deltaproteobacteria bacterium]